MGGSESVDFLAPSGSGENTLVTCENGDFAADLEVAQAVPRAPEFPPRLDAPEEIETPGVTHDRGARRAARHRRGGDVEGDADVKEDGTVVLALVRGDDRLEDAKLVAALGADVRPATEDEIRAAFGADPGSLGPVGFDGEIVADEALREGQFVAGANRTGWHLRGVEHGPRLRGALRRHPRAEGGRQRAPTAAARSASRPRSRSATSSSSARATRCRSTRRSSTRTAPRSRWSWAATASAPAGSWPPRSSSSTTSTGICWPAAIAPYDVHVVALPGRRGAGEEAARVLAEAGADVLLDDRDLRAGREVRRRRPDRPADARDGRQEDARGRHGRRARPA